MNKQQQEALDARTEGREVSFQLDGFKPGYYQLVRLIDGREDTWRTLDIEQLNEMIGH